MSTILGHFKAIREHYRTLIEHLKVIMEHFSAISELYRAILEYYMVILEPGEHYLLGERSLFVREKMWKYFTQWNRESPITTWEEIKR